MRYRRSFHLVITLLTALWVGFSVGCQSGGPMLKKDPSTPKPPSNAPAAASPVARAPGTVSGPMAEQQAEMDGLRLVSTPFGLVRLHPKKSGPFASASHPVSRPVPAPEDPSRRNRAADPETSAIANSTGAEKKQAPRKAEPAPSREFLTVSVESVDPLTEASDTGEISLNFDNADLKEVIRALADILKMNYIVDPSVRGNVTIHTAGNVKIADLFGVFMQILEMNGFTAVKSGALYRIVPLKKAAQLPMISRFGRENAGTLQPEERVVMQIIPLQYIAAAEMAKLLTPFVSTEGAIVSHEKSNILIVVDKGINILKVLRLVTTFDIDLFRNSTHRMYSVQYMDAEEMVKVLKNALAAYGKDEKTDFKMFAIERLNRIIAISSDPAVFDRLDTLIQDLDRPDDAIEPRIHVYFVKNGRADELAELLMAVFSSTSDKGAAAGRQAKREKPEVRAPAAPAVPSTPFPMEKKEMPPPSPAAPPATAAEGSSTLRGKIKITADPTRNALIIEAIPSDFRIIENILSQLDVLPRQVLIEVVIAEISLDAKDELGVNWTYEAGPGGLSSSVLNAQIGESGLQFTIGQTDRWSVTLGALASENKLDILSTPVVLASDNKEARIDVSDEIPVASAEFTYSGVTPITQTNIQYRNTGIILTVTPHINDHGLVSMDIVQEVSEEGGNKLVAGKTYPSFRQRKVVTTLTVNHNQTIVMGGLMRKRAEKNNSGVPVLSTLPGIGFLFGKNTQDGSKVELILLITPRVIVNLADVDTITEEFKEKVKSITNSQKGGAHP